MNKNVTNGLNICFSTIAMKATLFIAVVLSSNPASATEEANDAQKLTYRYLDINGDDGMNKEDAEFVVNLDHEAFLSFAASLNNKSWAVRETEDKYISIFNNLLDNTSTVDIRHLVQCSDSICMGSFKYKNELEMSALFDDFSSSSVFDGALVTAFVDDGIANFIFNYRTSVFKTLEIK